MADSEAVITPEGEDAPLHGPILDNRPAAASLRQAAFNRAIARGVSEDRALRLYGNGDPQPG